MTIDHGWLPTMVGTGGRIRRRAGQLLARGIGVLWSVLGGHHHNGMMLAGEPCSAPAFPSPFPPDKPIASPPRRRPRDW